MDTLFISVVWVLPSVLLGVLIGHYWGRAPVLIRERKLAQEERQVTLKALLTLMESTQQLSTDVDSHTSEFEAVQRSVGGLQVPVELQSVQSTLVKKVTEVIEANHRLEDDLVVARYRMQEQRRSSIALGWKPAPTCFPASTIARRSRKHSISSGGISSGRELRSR